MQLPEQNKRKTRGGGGGGGGGGGVYVPSIRTVFQVVDSLLEVEMM